MDRKFCPFISTDTEKRECHFDCTFWNTYERACNFKIKPKQKISVGDGIRILIGFTLLALIVSGIVMLFFTALGYSVMNK